MPLSQAWMRPVRVDIRRLELWANSAVSMAGEATDVEDLGELLTELRHLEFCLQETKDSLVRSARQHGYSWDEIGKTLWVSRQAAQQRYGDG